MQAELVDLLNKIGADLRNAGYIVCEDDGHIVERGERFSGAVHIVADDPNYGYQRVVGRLAPGERKWFVGVFGEQNFPQMKKLKKFVLEHYTNNVHIEQWMQDSKPAYR